MRTKILALGVGISFVFLILALSFSFFNSGRTSEKLDSPYATSSSASVALPQKLIIPKLKINVSVEQVGLDSENRMAVPVKDNDVGWYKFGPKPGEWGSAVIDGHVDSPTGPSVFYRLSELVAGDEIDIIDENSTTYRFLVRDKKVHSDANFPIADVFEKNDATRLNLITCTGKFDRLTKNYSGRLVIYALLSSE